MTICNLSNKKFNYEFEKLARLFYPFERIEVVNEIKSDEKTAVLREKKQENDILLLAKVSAQGKVKEDFTSVPLNTAEAEKERVFSAMLFLALCDITGFTPPWGILTGVRPARLYLSTVKETGKEKAGEYFREKLLVSDDKISLCKEVASREESIINSSRENDFSLYVSIPFCPSRCRYCSFVSHSVESAARLIPDYINCLCKEIEFTARKARRLNLNLKTVYIGGGTPTTLAADQLKTMLDCIRENFDFSNISEFTLEAGRPDTITEEKLKVIKEAAVSRISVNPQTLVDGVLENIGRKHTSAQFEEAFYLARKTGFDNINCDLIAGLPGDNAEGFDYTLKRITELAPESVTVHALAMKRASFITQKGEFHAGSSDGFAAYAVSSARENLCRNGYLPYYTYRQSKTAGNLENTGYAKPGFEGLYNVFIMDETHTILGVGASAVTKIVPTDKKLIKRIFNYKYPYEYISRFEEIKERKEEMAQFYEKHD